MVLSHLGLEADSDLARAVPEIPLIVGGHSHVALRGGERVGETLIVQAGAYGEQLGKLVLHFDRAQRRGREIDATERRSRSRRGHPRRRGRGHRGRVGRGGRQRGPEVVGAAAIPLHKGRGKETALGNLITDAMRAADLGDGRQGRHRPAQRRRHPRRPGRGPITYAELYAVLPFDNSLVGMDLTGDTGQRDARRRDQQQRQRDTGLGAELCLLSKQVARTEGDRGRGRRRNPGAGRRYRVVTIDYLSAHPQYEDSLGKGTGLTYGPLCLDALIDHVRAHSPVQPKTEQRIRRM